MNGSKLKTVGISPKVLIPAVAQVLAGILFLLFGLVVEGKTAILTGVGTLVAGFASPAAPVVTVSTSNEPVA